MQDFFKKYSKAGVGIIVYILLQLGKHYGVDLDEGDLTETATNLLEVVAQILVVYGQFARKDLSMGIARKK